MLRDVPVTNAGGPENSIISHFLINSKIPKRQVKMDVLMATTKYCIISLARLSNGYNVSHPPNKKVKN